MRVNWKECPRGDVVGQWAEFYVTMNTRGHIVFSRKTYERLGEPKAFILRFDEVNNRIGLKPTSAGIRNAYPAAKYGKHGGKLVRAWRLMEEFGIELPATLQFDSADIDQDGVLVLDLRTAKVSQRSIAHKRTPPVEMKNSNELR
jgi:hypothetical protein